MTTFSTEQLAMLTEKLDAGHVKPPQKFGPKGDYLEGWFVIAEANRIFGFDGWSYEVVTTECVSQMARAIGKEKRDGFGVTYTSKVRVMVAGIVREDFGAGHGYDVDCGLAHESAIKEAVTDALKRALRTFGNPFGLALYDKTRANVTDGSEPNSQAPPQPKPISAAENKRQLAEIDADLLDCRTVEDVKRCAAIWHEIATRDGWSRDYKMLAREKFDERRAAVTSTGTVEDIQDQFPGSRVVAEVHKEAAE